MEYSYKTKGVCAKQIKIEIEGTIIQKVEFMGGCDGNAKGLASLLVGMEMGEAIGRMKGITCGWKKTSCPDQMALALEEIQKNQE